MDIATLTSHIVKCLEKGDKLTAIREYRKATEYPLQDCMEFVTHLLNGIKLKGASMDENVVEFQIPKYVQSVQTILTYGRQLITFF